MFRVLIVDDSEALRGVICDALRMRFPSIDLLEAGNSDDALRQVESRVPDLLLADIGLPGPSGLTLASIVRAAHPDVTIAIFTQHDDPEYRQAAFRCGADTFLSKSSVHSDELMTFVEGLIFAKDPTMAHAVPQ
jgi:DNA-binding NarL/FixJ family response regulator